MNKFWISLGFTLLLLNVNSNKLCAQANQPPDSIDLLITQDNRIDALLEKATLIAESSDGMEGFRVQISFGSSKKEALETKTKFTETFTDIDGFVVYDVPYFKVRTGNFRTHLEAEKVLKDIKDLYPGAFIVKDLIPIPEIGEQKD